MAKKVDTSKIPPSNGGQIEWVNEKGNGTTEDIIQTVLEMDSETGPEMCEFAQQFDNGIEGLKKLWKFVRTEINYDLDPGGEQWIQTPAHLYDWGSGDCKSKTIFVNAVLHCLDIPYFIRFTRYDYSDTKMRHVYTVAVVNGREIPIDTVYYKFGKEKPFAIKKDFQPMTKIAKISGCDDNQPAVIPMRVPTPAYHKQKAKEVLTDAIYVSKNNLQAHLEEIRQKQDYVPQAENIPFNKVSEGVAMLQIAKRELEVIGTMKPMLKAMCEKGVNLLQKAIDKKDFSLTGDIPNELKGVCAKIAWAKKLVTPANSYGYLGAQIATNKAIRKKYAAVGAFPERLCLDGLWFRDDQDNYNYTPMVADMSANFGQCQLDWNQFRNNINPFTNQKWEENTYLFYGRNSQYRGDFKDNANSFWATLNSLASGNNPVIHGLQGTSAWFNNQLDYDTALAEIAQNSNVLSNYLNDIYATQPGGSLGSGLLYTFTGNVTQNGQPINPNLYPATVIAKSTIQKAFLDGSVFFSGVSESNIKGMARNGILYDNGGEQPEMMLGKLVNLYNDSYGGVGTMGVAEIITLVTAILAACVAAAQAIYQTVKKADMEAKRIDQSAADTARLGQLGPSNLAATGDFSPIGNGGSGGDYTPWILAAAAAAAIGAVVIGEEEQ